MDRRAWLKYVIWIMLLWLFSILAGNGLADRKFCVRCPWERSAEAVPVEGPSSSLSLLCFVCFLRLCGGKYCFCFNICGLLIWGRSGFLDASSHLYMRVCSSDRPWVRPWVHEWVRNAFLDASSHLYMRVLVRPSICPSVCPWVNCFFSNVWNDENWGKVMK